MATIAEAGNTFYPALVVLRSKGYRLRWRHSERTDRDDFWALKDGEEFVASGPEALLGIVTLWETYGRDWQADIREVEFDETETFTEDANGRITSTVQDENGTRTVVYEPK